MASRSFMLLGQCVPCVKQNASKIRIRRMDLDKNLLMVIFYMANSNMFFSYCI